MENLSAKCRWTTKRAVKDTIQVTTLVGTGPQTTQNVHTHLANQQSLASKNNRSYMIMHGIMQMPMLSIQQTYLVMIQMPTIQKPKSLLTVQITQQMVTHILIR